MRNGEGGSRDKSNSLVIKCTPHLAALAGGEMRGVLSYFEECVIIVSMTA